VYVKKLTYSVLIFLFRFIGDFFELDLKL